MFLSPTSWLPWLCPEQHTPNRVSGKATERTARARAGDTRHSVLSPSLLPTSDDTLGPMPAAPCLLARYQRWAPQDRCAPCLHHPSPISRQTEEPCLSSAARQPCPGRRALWEGRCSSGHLAPAPGVGSQEGSPSRPRATFSPSLEGVGAKVWSPGKRGGGQSGSRRGRPSCYLPLSSCSVCGGPVTADQTPF